MSNINQQPWVCLKGRENDYDGYFYELVGNSEGLKALGEKLISLSSTGTENVSADIATVKEHDIVLERVVVTNISFDEFKLLAKKEPAKENIIGSMVAFMIFLFVIILFVAGVINGFKTLF
ncbi:MAG TPA: hypothetical protein PLW44_06680 [Chitinophagales bacterium]|nr:hypothetical protein [Chitinophagales bacterium]